MFSYVIKRIILNGTIFIPGELFYVCSLQYPYVLNHSYISLWYRIIGIPDTKLENHKYDKSYNQTVPLLLADPIALLLRIILSISFSIIKGISI